MCGSEGTEEILEPVELGMEMDGFEERKLVVGEPGEIGVFAAGGLRRGRMSRVPEYVRDGCRWEVVGFEVDAATCSEEGEVQSRAACEAWARVIGVGVVICVWDWSGSENVGENQGAYFGWDDAGIEWREKLEVGSSGFEMDVYWRRSGGLRG